MSYSGYKSSPRGGRGFSRGGYRGGGSSRGGDNSGWRGGGGRGYGSSSRGSGRGGRYSSGSGKWDRDASSSSYESRSRYNSGGDRYSSHSRDDNSYRYRNDHQDSISSYTSRDHSHRAASPDRKRMRSDFSPASSMHRSHDYNDGNEYSSRSYSNYENKRMSGGYGGGDERRAMFREERERIRSDDYQFRKPLNMGSPRHSTPRGSSRGTSRGTLRGTPRGSTFRGRSSFSRGLRSGFRRTESYRGGGGFLRKRTMGESYGMRRRIATGKTQEYLRRLKLYRLERLRRLRERAEKGESDEDDDENDEIEEIEEEEEVEEEVTDEDNEGIESIDKEEDKGSKEIENQDEEMDDVNEEKKDEPKKKTKKVKKIVKVIKKVKRKTIKPKEGSEKDPNESNDSKDLQVTVKQDSEGRDVDAPVRKNYLGEPFMKLECPHCHTIADTFKDYLLHLYKSKHQTAMTNLTVKVRKTLAKMRLDQRNEQRDLDEECKLKNMNMRTFYCLVCKLNYRSLKSEHLRSEKHKEMLNFLNPYCKICRVACRTPMMYENHICSLDHLKRKHYFDKKNAEKQEGNELDMDKFMILDQVGSGEEEEEDEDESDSETSGKAEKEKEEDKDGEAGENKEEDKEKKPKKKKKPINLGSEYCKKINIYFCELCKTFLPRIEDQEQALAVHCRGSSHLRWYVKKKDDLALRKRAERIHRMREEQKKAAIKEKGKEDETMEVDTSEGQTNDSKKRKLETGRNEDIDIEAGMDPQTWTEVSRDLGDLMGVVEEEMTNKSSDDEEDSRAAGRRYDRFKHSEKAKAGGANDNEAKSVEEKIVKAETVNGGNDKENA